MIKKLNYQLRKKIILKKYKKNLLMKQKDLNCKNI